MDPLSISFGIAGVLPLIAKTITTARSFIQSVIGADKMVTALILELEVLQGAIRKLDALLRSAALDDDDLKFDHASVLLSCSAAIEAKLQDLLRKLTRASSPARALGARRLLWPLSEAEHRKTLAELRGLAGWVQLALSVDGCRLLAQTADRVVAALAGQLERFRADAAAAAMTEQLRGEVRRQTAAAVEGRAEREARGRILDWLSTARWDARQAILRRGRARDTGKWLLESTGFGQWREGRTASRVLWCNGIQGSGKTMLACAAIDELRSHGYLAYFYFDYQDHDSQSPIAVVSSILRQLLDKLPNLPASVRELYEARGKLEGQQLPAYERLLDEVIGRSEVTYLVLDALDECEHGRYMLRLIDRLNQIDSCRILVTSRPHVYKQLPVSQSYAEIKIEAREEDIKRYVLEQCDAADIYQIADERFVDQLVGKLTRSASGMFLLPVLQLRTVLNEPTIGEMEDKLDQLTDVLSDAFEETLSRIRRLPGSRSRLALSALMHLAHARRLLRAAELSDILALRPDSASANAKYRPTARIIIECCQGLVSLDEQTGQLRLAHYAIQEYLVATSETLFPRFEARLALECLGYMLLDDFKSGPLDAGDAIDARLEAYPFLSYVSEFWGSYVRPVETDPEVWGRLLALYASLPAASAATQVLYYQKGYHEGYYDVPESVSTTPLHHAADNCLVHSARVLLGHFAVDEATAMGTTPIIKAAAGGHVAVVALLLERGADPRLRNWYGDALQCAAEAGECATIRQLVAWGMSPDGEPGCDRSPLSCALDRDSAHAVELLADLGADLRLEEEDEHENVFLEACRVSGEKTVEMMLRRGWVDLHSRPHHTVLAMRAATLPMLRRLIEAGADVNAVDKHGRTVLWYMRQELNDKAIDSLRGAGATLDGNTGAMHVDVSAPELKTGGYCENGLGVGDIDALDTETLAPEPKEQFLCDLSGCAPKFDGSVELQYHRYFQHDTHGRLLPGLVAPTSTAEGNFKVQVLDPAGLANHPPLPIRSQDEILRGASQAPTQQNEQQDRATQHPCPYSSCGKAFDTKTIRHRHIRDRHEKDGPHGRFFCSVDGCEYSRSGGKTFPRKDNWYRHMLKAHGRRHSLDNRGEAS